MIPVRSVAWIAGAIIAAGTSARAQREPAVPPTLFIGGAGGVYLLAPPGELVIDVYKRDLNRRDTRAELRAILAGPDRRVLREAIIPDDGLPRGGIGPVQTARLDVTVASAGVHVLNVTISQDRYGETVAWGFTTNCPRYLIETARGHRDQRHEEPIVLLNPDRPGDVCFLPRNGAFTLDIAGLPKETRPVAVFDAGDRPIVELRPDEEGRLSHRFPDAGPRRAVPWRIHLPSSSGVVHIDGVTRWQPDDALPDSALWTPDAKSWFPLHDYRWLVTPWQRTVYGEPGAPGKTVFQIHNNSARRQTIRLAVEFSGAAWPVEPSAREVVLDPKQATTVSLGYAFPPPGESRTCRLRGTPVDGEGFSTCSTLDVRSGAAPAAGPLPVPLVLKPYQHENEQWGYLPDYPVENPVCFDAKNRPFEKTARGVSTLREGTWQETALDDAVRRRVPPFDEPAWGAATSKVAFDRDGDVYLLTRGRENTALLQSADGGGTFTAFAIPARADGPQSFDIEDFTGHNTPDGPPPILRYTRTAQDPNHFWRRIHDLELILGEKRDGGIAFRPPILITRQCIGLASHSGIPSTVVSRGDKVHVVWGEATDPAEKAPGVPTYVVTVDRTTGKPGRPARVGYGPPANDIHNSPSITMDRQGFLHVLCGTHGAPFPYARSLAPNDAGAGWTEAEVLDKDLRQTYIGMVCGPDDTLYAAFRMWRSGVEPHPASVHAALAFQRKPPGKPWEAPQPLVAAAFSEYSVYYHRLTLDRAGRLFLSYDYWSTHWFYRNDHRGARRALLMSPDGGRTWKLAGGGDFGR